MADEEQRASVHDHRPGGEDSADGNGQQELIDDLRRQAAAWARKDEVDRLVGELADSIGEQRRRPKPLADQYRVDEEEEESDEITPNTWLGTAW